MSLLMYILDPEQIAVVTDTLATSPDHEPMFYVSKCAIVPHLELAIAGTGIQQLGTRWLAGVYNDMLCIDIEMLDHHTPDALRRIWSEILPDLPGQDATTTIYQFGYSEQQARYVGYAYRSKNDFVSEQLQDTAFAAKPPPAALEKALKEESLEDFSPPSNLEELVEVARQIRREQDDLPLGEGLHIGGELTLCLMRDRVISTSKIHRWEDFVDEWNAMNRRARLAGEVL